MEGIGEIRAKNRPAPDYRVERDKARKELRVLRASVKALALKVGAGPIPADDDERGWNALCAAILGQVEEHWDPV